MVSELHLNLLPPVTRHDLLAAGQGPQIDPVLLHRPDGDHMKAQLFVLQVLPQGGGDGGLDLGGDLGFFAHLTAPNRKL